MPLAKLKKVFTRAKKTENNIPTPLEVKTYNCKYLGSADIEGPIVDPGFVSYIAQELWIAYRFGDVACKKCTVIIDQPALEVEVKPSSSLNKYSISVKDIGYCTSAAAPKVFAFTCWNDDLLRCDVFLCNSKTKADKMARTLATCFRILEQEAKIVAGG